jgi:arabinofuranosyltransferase
VLRWSLVFLLPGLLYFLWRFSYFGYLLPNTYYAKGAGSVDLAKRGLIYLALFGRIYLLPLVLLVPLAGIALFSRRKEGSHDAISADDPAAGTESSRAGNDRHGSGWWLIPIAMFLIPYTIYVVAVGGDYMAMFRFIVPVIPLIYLIVQELFRLISQAAGSWWRLVEIAMIGLIFAYTLLPSLTMRQMKSIGLPDWLISQYQKPQYMHGYADGVANERWHSARLTLIGKYFREFADSSEDSIVTNAIGAVSYYSGIRVYGEHGLVDTHIAHLSSEHLGQSLAGHEKADYEYLLRKRPTFVMGTRQLFPRMASKPELLQGLPPYFRRHMQDYRVVNAPMIDRANGEQGFFVFFALKGHGKPPTTSWFDPAN